MNFNSLLTPSFLMPGSLRSQSVANTATFFFFLIPTRIAPTTAYSALLIPDALEDVVQ